VVTRGARFGVVLLLVAGGISGAACGARTELDTGNLLDGSMENAGDGATDVRDSGPEGLHETAVDTRPPSCRSDVECDDGIVCTDDRCQLTTGTCEHQPDNKLCPPGFTCGPPRACVPTAFANTQTDLYGTVLPEGTIEHIGATGGHALNDIALASDGRLFGISSMFLYSIDPLTGRVTLVGPVAGFPNALDFGPDGTLYAAAAQAGSAIQNGIFTVDPTTGIESLLTTLPSGYGSSGDLAVFERTMYVTVAGGSEDELAIIDLDTLASDLVGPIGFGCIWGLAATSDGSLFGFTCIGQVIEIDPETAKGTLVSMQTADFAGATAR
jgi:hypothetical protein